MGFLGQAGDEQYLVALGSINDRPRHIVNCCAIAYKIKYLRARVCIPVYSNILRRMSGVTGKRVVERSLSSNASRPVSILGMSIKVFSLKVSWC